MKRLFALLVVALSCRGVLAQQELTRREIVAAFKSPDSFVRFNTWKQLNPENRAQYKILVRILRTQPWYDRQGAVEALLKAGSSETLERMVRDLKRHKDLAVRQGMSDALAKMKEDEVEIKGKDVYSHLYDILDDKNPLVRRMVAHHLRVHKKKEAVEALIQQFQRETDPVVRSFILSSLNSLTQAYQGPSPIAWSTWWQQAKADEDYELGEVDEESLRKAEELGNKLKKRKTLSVAGGVTLETEERGKLNSVPILIIPYYGYSKKTMMPFLSELEKTNKLFYIDLPPINSFNNLKVVSAKKIPYYPIDRLVEAFEDLRKATGQDRFALMACGMNAWIAMRYANLHPESVSHLVFISPLSSNKAYGTATKRMESQGKEKKDRELWHFALTRTFNRQTGESTHDSYHTEKEIPKPEGEDGSIDRRSWSLYFKDERDSLIGMLYPIKDQRMGSVAIPDFRCFTEPPRARIPTIVITGKSNLYSSVDDCKAIAKHFGGKLYVYPNTAGMPFAEDSALFNKHMAFLLREASKAKAKKAKKKRKAKRK